MRTVWIYTDRPEDDPRYAALIRSKKWEVAFGAREAVRKAVSKAGADLCYVDAADAGSEELESILRSILRKGEESCPVGIIDPGGLVRDPAWLFHKGFVDYVGPALAEEGLGAKRLDSVAAFAAPPAPTVPQQPATAQASGTASGRDAERRDRRSGPVQPEGPESWGPTSPPPNLQPVSGWSDVRASHEYTFWLLYVDLDEAESYRRISSDSKATGLFDAFRRVVERYAQDFQGRIWMWKESGGLVLFPFDGQSPGAIVTAVRLALNRPIITVEDMPAQGHISYRLALHLGNTVFEEKGETGTIVSDAVNLTFHLGQRYTAPGGFTMTEQAAHFVSPRLVPWFADAGVFESAQVYRMREVVRAGAYTETPAV
jgi:hypothetical protein